jgi:hypothetical protein
MLTKVEVTSARLEVPVLLLGEFYPNQNPIQILDISGLEPVDAEITTTPFAQDGELFLNARLSKRNIVLKLGFNPNWVDQTVSSLRQMLYKYFLPKAWCKLRFYSNDMPTVEIEGYVESFEPNIFSQDPEIQVSVLCPQPDFVGIDRTTYYGNDISAIQLSIEYYGTVETGFELKLDLFGSTTVENFLVQRQRPDLTWDTFETRLVNANSAYYYYLSTIKNYKRTRYTKISDGSEINQFRNMLTGTSWPLIKPGPNTLKAWRFNYTNATPRAWSLWFYNRYGGL